MNDKDLKHECWKALEFQIQLNKKLEIQLNKKLETKIKVQLAYIQELEAQFKQLSSEVGDE